MPNNFVRRARRGSSLRISTAGLTDIVQVRESLVLQLRIEQAFFICEERN